MHNVTCCTLGTITIRSDPSIFTNALKRLVFAGSMHQITTIWWNALITALSFPPFVTSMKNTNSFLASIFIPLIFIVICNHYNRTKNLHSYLHSNGSLQCPWTQPFLHIATKNKCKNIIYKSCYNLVFSEWTSFNRYYQ